MKEHLIKQVSEIMRQIDDTADLIKIYTVAKTYLKIQQEDRENEQRPPRTTQQQKRHNKKT